MAAASVLANSSRLRYFTGASLYFAQGIPQGFLMVAIPAWLISEGVSAGEVGSYIAVLVLPWVFKLVTGPFMDRFEYLPMGRRRPWVLGAQLGLTGALLALMLVKDPVSQFGLLMFIGLIVESFAATQDVATDGMAIELTPVDEQGRLNAFMSFGKAAGWGISSAVSGTMLVKYGMGPTAVVCAAGAAVVFVLMIFVLERDGEKRLPFTPGKASSTHKPGASFRDVFSGLNKVLWTRTSLVVMAIMFTDGLVAGYGQALMPVAAVQVFGYSTAQWSQMVAVMGLVGAAVSLGLGPFIDRFGPKIMMLITILLLGVHAFALAQTQLMWEDSSYVRFMLGFWIMMKPVVMVCAIALGMSICASRNSATQFAIYMSCANLGYSGGSKFFGVMSESISMAQNYLLMGALVVVAMVVILLHRHHKESVAQKKKGANRYTIPTSGGGAGMFLSGAMRCPKCRADMELVEHQGVEIDRCIYCKGLWFDEGEMEALGDASSAKAIDTGSARAGRQTNKIDDYDCPRCGSDMDSKIDSEQQHIQYEACTGCGGSFFDAGEFRDLSEITLSDFFKRLSVRRQ